MLDSSKKSGSNIMESLLSHVPPKTPHGLLRSEGCVWRTVSGGVDEG